VAESRTSTAEEALDLLNSLRVWAEGAAEGSSDPGWHTHITDADGNELTIADGPDLAR
jgi:hypothetical protein